MITSESCRSLVTYEEHFKRFFTTRVKSPKILQEMFELLKSICLNFHFKTCFIKYFLLLFVIFQFDFHAFTKLSFDNNVFMVLSNNILAISSLYCCSGPVVQHLFMVIVVLRIDVEIILVVHLNIDVHIHSISSGRSHILNDKILFHNNQSVSYNFYFVNLCKTDTFS